MNTLLLIDCSDQKGLIAKVSQTLFDKNLNIIHMKEHVDPSTQTFYMRCEFSGATDLEDLKSDLKQKLPKDAHIRITLRQKKNLVLLATKEHHCLSDLLLRHYFKEINADIKCVISNHQNLKEIVSKFGVEFVHITHENKTKDTFESELLAATQKYNPDYLVLAKFMRILSPNFVAQYPQRMINIHHSFLPAFVGANPYQQAYDRGIKIIGATAHFVTNDLDEGPIITQKIKNVDHGFSAEDMRQSGKDIERLALAEALEHVLEDRIFITGNRTVIFN